MYILILSDYLGAVDKYTTMTNLILYLIFFQINQSPIKPLFFKKHSKGKIYMLRIYDVFIGNIFI